MIKTRRSHIVLLEFIPAEHDQLARVIFPQHDLDELPAERTGAARHEHHLLCPVHRLHVLNLSWIIAA